MRIRGKYFGHSLHHIPLLRVMLFCIILSPLGLSAEEESNATMLSRRGQVLLSESRFAEAEAIFRNWVNLEPDNPDAHFQLAMSQALQGRHDSALADFRKALNLNPRLADAWFEIAGICVIKQNYREGLDAAYNGLRLKPGSDYGLDLAGTLNYLMGSKIQALRFWNKLGRPRLNELRITSSKLLDRQKIADEIPLQPDALVSYSALQKAQWRLRQHGYIRSTLFQPVPDPQSDRYNLDVQIESRKGFGTPIELLANAVAGIGFHTYRISYWNLFNSGLTISAPMRFKSSARWAQLEFNAPRPAHLDLYASARYGWRDESWNFASAQNDSVAVYRIRMHEGTGSFLLPVYAPKILVKAEVAVRRRLLESPDLTSPSAVNSSAGVHQAEPWKWVTWLRLSPSFTLFDYQSLTGWRWTSRLNAAFDIGRSQDPLARRASRFSASWEGEMGSNSTNGGLQRIVHWGLHGGTLTRTAFMEDHFLIGIGPEVRFQLRAHPLFREGKLGSTPLASEFILGNLTIAHDIHNWKYFSLGLTGFCDAAHFSHLYPSQKLPSTAVDAGIGIEFGLKGNAVPRFVLTYGRDLKSHRNVFYFSTALR